MKSERHQDQSVSSGKEVNPKDAGVKPAARRIAYKTVLAAVVISIITISVLWFFLIRQERNPANATLVTEPSIKVLEETKVEGPQVALMADEIELIDRRLLSMTGQIERGFEAQQASSSNLKHQLSDMSQDIQAIKSAISDQRETIRQFDRQISEAISQLDTVIKDARAPKVVKPKPAARRKPRPVKTPPFQIDAIDVWDDRTYVAVSQASRVAFLAAGEQQSGWRVTHIDRLKGHVDLQDPAGQAHSISLPR